LIIIFPLADCPSPYAKLKTDMF